jgi:lipopolysaccharide exporter
MGWSMTGLGLLRREMRFRALSVISIGAYVVGYLVVGVGLALLGAGVWSLVAATVTSTLIQAVWQFAILRHPLRPVLRWRPYQTVCGYGTRLQVAWVLDYLGGNLDTFTIARIASPAMLGQYSRAYYLVFQPLGNYLSAALTNVAFAALSRVQEDATRLRRGYLSMTSLSALLVFPLCAGMAVAAPDLVATVLGSQWGPAVGLVPWFALAGGCHVASQLSQSLAEARVPAVFASAGVALAIAAVHWALTGAPSVALLAAEIMAGALALALCIRVCPTPAVRAELRFRLASAGLLGPSHGRRRRLALLVLGSRDRVDGEGRR